MWWVWLDEVYLGSKPVSWPPAHTHAHTRTHTPFACSVATLLRTYGTFPESLCRKYTVQVLVGLEFLHRNLICHRDLKGGNILITDAGLVKLADFGASKRLQAAMTLSNHKSSIKGTPYWMAPEVVRQERAGRKADVWSCACTVVEMLTGCACLLFI